MGQRNDKRPEVSPSRTGVSINSIEPGLEMLTGPDKTARLNVEIDAIEKLLSTKEEVLKNLSEMKASGGEWWMQIKAGLQERLSVLDNSVKLLESKRS